MKHLNPFIGRQEELADLKRLMSKETASFVVVRGRRRIGKSRLIEEFAKGVTFYSFSGLFPVEGTTAQSQREEFARQINRETGLPEVKSDDWGTLFSYLYEKIKKGKIVLLFDEISWMGSKDPDFLGKIKNAWDILFKKNPRLIFVVCGSASSWIEKNILSSTGFVGRVSYRLTLEELPLSCCNKFWGKASGNISPYEKFKILSITGGVPKYLEEINPKLSAEENIKNLCFKPEGYFFNEFDHIFSNLFLHRSNLYKKIVEVLVGGNKDVNEICAGTKIDRSGRVNESLEELELAGYIKRDYTWNIKDGKDVKLSKYRLSDNYLRFYLKYIGEYKTKIERNAFSIKTITALPGWSTILGFQFENLVLSNRTLIHQALGVRPEDIVSENPFFQTATSKRPGCQVDYMIQTKFNTLYICEIKFSKNFVGINIIQEVEEKINRLKRPRGFSCRPVLIHVNGVSEEIVDGGFFSEIIDMSRFLEVFIY